MWLFNRATTPKSSKPVQRQISIRTRDEQGDGEGYSSYESTPQRGSPFPGLSNSRSSFTSPNHNQHQGDEVIGEDDTETTSSSDGHSSGAAGRPEEVRASRNSSYNREPLDARLWSNVSSPGFTTRAVQEANGHGLNGERISPLREILSSRSPFTRSPNGNLRIGQLPISAVPRRSVASVTNFPTPRGRSLFAYGRYSRVGRRDGKTGTVFVKLAPVDMKGAGPPVTPNTPSPGTMSMSASGVLSMPSYNDPGSPGGLGGIPQSGLTQRFSRLWPNMPHPHNTGIPGYQPSNIADALANRKRGRETELRSSEANKIIRQTSSSTPISSPEEANKYPKRVKFVNDQEMRLNRPLAFDSYHDSSPNVSQPMTSILEQMNQTEKRFLPDSSLTSTSKKSKMMGSPPRGQSTPITARKRRGNNGISMVENEEDDDPRSKTGKFCHCNECYREAAGMTSYMQTSPTRSTSKTPPGSSPVGSSRKTVTFDETALERDRRSKAHIDKGTETDLQSKTEVIIWKANHSSGYITKDKYDDDRIRRLERFRRILGLQKPEQSSKDQVDGLKSDNGFTSGIMQPVTLPESITTPAPIHFSGNSISSSGAFTQPSGDNLLKLGESELSSESGLQKKQEEPEKDQEPRSTIANFTSGSSQSETAVPAPALSISSSPIVQSNVFSSSVNLTASSSESVGGLKPVLSGPENVVKVEPKISPILRIQKEESTNDPFIASSGSTIDQSLTSFGTGNGQYGSTHPTGSLSSPAAQLNLFSTKSDSSSDGFKILSQPSSFSATVITSQPSTFGSMGGNTGGSTNLNPSISSTTASSSTPTFGSSSFTGSASSIASPSTTFSFGGSQAKPGGFSFGQPQAPTDTNTKPVVLNFGQTDQQQSTPGGFTLSAQTQPSTVESRSITPGMFNLGTTTTAATIGFGNGQDQSITTISAAPTTTTGAQLSSFPNISSSGLPNSTSEGFKPSSQPSPFSVTSGTSKPSTFSSLGQTSAGSMNLNPSTPTPSFGSTSFTGSSNASPANSLVFGGSQTTSAGGFSFGQTTTQTTANSQPSVLNFGQTAQPQSTAGGFNFSGQSQPSSAFGASPGGPGVFGLGSGNATTAAPGTGFGNGNALSGTTLSRPAPMSTVVPQLNSFSSNSGNGMNSNSSDAFKPPSFSGAAGTGQANAFGSIGQNAAGSMNSNSSSTSTPAFGSTSFAGSGTSTASPFGGSQSNSVGFSFGQSQPQVAANPQPSVLSFGQTAPPQSSGGFNFSAAAQPSSAFGASSGTGVFNLGTSNTTASRPAFGTTNGQSLTSSTSMSSPSAQMNAFSNNSSNLMNNSSSEAFKPSSQISPFGATSGTTQSNIFGSISQNGSGSMNLNQSTASAPAFGSSSFGGPGAAAIPNSFSFGSTQPASGGFPFGQQQQANPSQGFNFGQAAQQQSSPGGFNFSGQAQPPPPYGANPAPGMFAIGASATAPRSRNTRLRKYR